MAASGICVLLPFYKGHAGSNTLGQEMDFSLLVLRKLLGRRGFDIANVTELSAMRALANTNDGKNPNAPYHSFIVPMFGYYAGGSAYDQGEYQSAFSTIINTDLTTADGTVHYYIGQAMDPNAQKSLFPGGTGAGMGVSGSANLKDGVWEDITVKLGSATVPYWGSTKLCPANTNSNPPANVTYDAYNAGGDAMAWTYKNQAHYWNIYNTGTSGGDIRRDGSMAIFILWILGHITKIRGKTIPSKKIKVWVDLDDYIRQSTPTWYAAMVNTRTNLTTFGRAARDNGLGRVNLATEAAAASLTQANTDGLIAVIVAGQNEGLFNVHPHTHDLGSGIVAPSALASDADAVTMYNLMKSNLQAKGLYVDPNYLTNEANLTNAYWERGCASVGIKVMRGGTFVSATQTSSSPMYYEHTNNLIKTGSYEGGWVAGTSTYRFTVSGLTTTPTGSAVYRNSGADDTSRWIVGGYNTISNGSGYIYMSPSAGPAPAAAPSTITKVSGTGDASISYSALTTITFGWEHVATHPTIGYPTSINMIKQRMFYTFIRAMLYGSSAEGDMFGHGFTGYNVATFEQPILNIVLHPDSVADDNVGTQIFGWLGQWRTNIYEFYEGSDSVPKIINVGYNL